VLEGTIRRHGWPKFTLVLLDFVGVTLAAVATLFLHYYTTSEYDVENSLGDYVLRVGILWISFPMIVLLFRQHLLYKYKVYSTGIAQFAQLSRALLINSLLLIAILFFLREDWIQHSRTNLFLFTLCSLLILSFFRLVLFRKMLLPAITGIESRRILLVGAGEEARTLLAENIGGRSGPFEVVALVDQNGLLSSESAEATVLTTVPLLKEFVPKYNIHEIIVAENDLPYEDVVRLIAEARETGVPIHLLSDHFKVIQERVTKSSSEFLNVSAAPVSHGVYGFYAGYLKRLVDILGAVVAITLLSPLLIVIVLAIKLGSKGPLFFSTEASGGSNSAR
jgi:FlaA1/EpsC-like NDP-sugar epimerase